MDGMKIKIGVGDKPTSGDKGVKMQALDLLEQMLDEVRAKAMQEDMPEAPDTENMSEEDEREYLRG